LLSDQQLAYQSADDQAGGSPRNSSHAAGLRAMKATLARKAPPEPFFESSDRGRISNTS
jgi:hypothetical protein